MAKKTEIHQVYEIQIVIPFYLGDSVQHVNPTEYNKLLKSMADKDKTKHVLRVQFAPMTPHEATHTYLLERGDKSQFSVTVNANVLGRGMGTPLLKTGIRHTGHVVEEISDAESTS